MFIIQRIFHGQGKGGEDIRNTLIVNIATADASLTKLKEYFDEEQEFDVKYNASTKRFSVNPKNKPFLEYHIVKDQDEAIIDEVIGNGEDTKSD